MQDAPRKREADLERQLVARALAGDHAAFGELFTLFHAPIYRICVDRLLDPGLAEDAMQDTFVRAFQALPRFDVGRRFFPWLATIAVNRAGDMRRRERRQWPTTLEPEVDTTAFPSNDIAATVVDRQRLDAALSALSASQRRMVIRHDLEGWSCAEVADEEGKSELAVRSSLCRARATLRALLRGIGWLGLTLRGLRRRGRNFVDNASPTAVEVAGLPFVGVSLVTATTISLILVISGLAPGSHGDPAENVRAPGAAAANVSAKNQLAARQDLPPRNVESTNRIKAGPVQASSRTKSKRHGAAAPPGNKVRLEIAYPNGEVIYYNETWLDCDEEVGKVPEAMPPGPVRAVC
jgi:RNA polymerase sigma factor (sigma-70 family)